MIFKKMKILLMQRIRIGLDGRHWEGLNSRFAYLELRYLKNHTGREIQYGTSLEVTDRCIVLVHRDDVNELIKHFRSIRTLKFGS